MTTDLEKQFFSTFGIEPKYEDACELADEYWNNEHLANEYGFFDNYMFRKGCTEHIEGCTDNCRHAYTKEIYPQITDRILLELICTLHKYSNKSCLLVKPYGENIEQLKKETLTSLIIFYKNTSRYCKTIYNQVQALFKE